jgi:hypothetical protein
MSRNKTPEDIPQAQKQAKQPTLTRHAKQKESMKQVADYKKSTPFKDM